MAWISPLFTVRSRPLRICFPPTVTCRFLISSIATVLSLQTEMRDDLLDQLLLLRLFSVRRHQAQRAPANVDLALLAGHDHYTIRVEPLLRFLQQNAGAIENRVHTMLLELLRGQHVGLVELLEESPRALLAFPSLRLVTCALRLKIRDRLIERRHSCSPAN